MTLIVNLQHEMKNSTRMKKILYKLLLLSGILLFPHASFSQQNYEFILDAKKTGAPINPNMYGVFFEDINFGADGGLYAELVKNRSFDFPQQLMGWNTFGKVRVLKENPLFENNPTYLELSYPGHDHKHTGIENEGFRGMGFKEGADYRFSVWAKKGVSEDQVLKIQLIDSNNNIIVNRELTISSPDWKKYQLILPSNKEEYKGRLRIFLASKGSVYVEHVSLFPTDTWKGRENGLRKDLVQTLADLRPGVFRFPGGCIVEGTDLETRYNWKKSIGPVENRPLNENRWHYTFTHRFFPDYFQTYGMGFYEMFLLSEDIGAEPLPVLNCGLACQYQNNGEACHVPVTDLDEYVQDALDLIEFANGDVSSKWGKVRADMGHPEPFHLKYIGIGNEQWGPEYPARLEFFVKAIRKIYPSIKIIGSSGPSADGKEFDYLWPEMKRLKVDLVDEHYYKDPEWFLNNAKRYDSYDRKGPKVFAGEYACHTRPVKKNSFESALCEAAFLTGIERNADVVQLATYAPLFAHTDAWQWNPDLIWFDNLHVVKSVNYYVQQLYCENKGTNVLPLTFEKEPIAGRDGLYASAVADTDKKQFIIKLANTSKENKSINIRLTNLGKKLSLKKEVEVLLLKGDMTEENTLDNPTKIVPVTSVLPLRGEVLNVNVQPQSFNVYKITY